MEQTDPGTRQTVQRKSDREVIMLVKDAKDVARRWVIEEAAKSPGFSGAFYSGSVNWMPDEAILPKTSDVDVRIVLDDAVPPEKLGKFVYHDVILEASYWSADRFSSPEAVLGDYHMAGIFRNPNVILDPSGRLTKLQKAVSEDFAKRRWVRKRCEHARNNSLRFIASVDEGRPLQDQVGSWLFGTGVTTHVLLAAGLRNPTVRKRYAAARDLLSYYERLDFHESLLELLGCERMSRERVEHHLASLTEMFDATRAVVRTPFAFASDVSDVGRPISIDGTREMIETGYHRETVFWIVATHCRCRTALGLDAPKETQESFDPALWELLGDLGITSTADLRERGERVERFLPIVWKVAEEIMAANPEIKD